MANRFSRVVITAGVVLSVAAFAADGAPASETPVIVCAKDAPSLTALAAREVRRYVYLRTGSLLSIEAAPGRNAAIVVGAADGLEPQEYRIRTARRDGNTSEIRLEGGSGAATLYAAYRFAEHLGVRFYLHGDVIPDERIPLALPEINEDGKPLFELRGIQPFHDFPEGPDWWNPEDYMAIIAQLPKLRMNFFGLHTYSENRPNAEPTVWIGRPEDVAPDGSITAAYPAIWYNTVLPVGWGLQPKNTSDYACGAGALFDRDDYGNEVMRGLTPRPDSVEDCNEVFNRAGAMFRKVFGFARDLGVKTCIGTETPLVVPQRVAQRLRRDATPAKAGAALRADGGRVAHFTQAMAGTEDDPLYQSVRFDLKGYACDAPNGAYTVTLRFCEPAYAAKDKRVFGVKIEGNQVIDRLDVFAEVGKDHALDRSFENVAVDDGRLEIEFVYQVEYPCIAAIAVQGEGKAWKVNCGGGSYRDYSGEDSAASLAPEQVQRLYEGIFTRILRTHPLDYYWFWTPENWTWEDISEETVKKTVEDILSARRAAAKVNASFGLATCGWVLGPQYDRAYLDKMLPKEFSVSCISRAVGHDPVEPGFAQVEGRGKWAIPWLEDDPAMTSPQLWVGRMRRDARDALAYGCTGLMGIHWRTRILGPNVSALAQGAWDQTGWADLKASPKHPPADDFYADWALHLFGAEVAAEAGAIFSKVDGVLPRPSDWVGGPGGYTPDEKPWNTVRADYAFVDELAALQPRLEGAGNRERFDYWLNNLQFMRATAKMRCRWREFNVAMEAAKKQKDTEAKAQALRQEALPKRLALIAAVTEAYRHLLATVTTSGAMGTVANLEQHTFPGMLDKPGRELAALLGEALPEEAQLPRGYDGPPRLVVLTKRTLLQPGESLKLKAVLLDSAPAKAAAVRWRILGADAFKAAPLNPAGRGTVVAEIPEEAFSGHDIEYYLEVTPASGAPLRWPATAPGINQTVVLTPEQGSRQ